MKLKRVWVPVNEWEELQFNMWGAAGKRQDLLRRAIIFTGNHRLYGCYMQRVTHEWPRSCLNALTDYSINRRAWIGHAATALALHCPEDITRQAWSYLTYEQQSLANRQADRAIQSWEMRYRESLGIRQHLASPLLPERNPGRSPK
jgi:hypothetical protein